MSKKRVRKGASWYLLLNQNYFQKTNFKCSTPHCW